MKLPEANFNINQIQIYKNLHFLNNSSLKCNEKVSMEMKLYTIY